MISDSNISKLREISLEIESGPISEQSYNEFKSLFNIALENSLVIPESSEIRRKIELHAIDSKDVLVVSKAFAKMQMLDILQTKFAYLSNKTELCDSLFPLIDTLPSKEKKIEVLNILSPLFHRFFISQSDVFLRVLSFIPMNELNESLANQLAFSLTMADNGRPDASASMNYIFEKFPDLKSVICDNLLTKKNTNQLLLLNLNTLLIPQDHPLLYEINTIRRADNTNKVVSHFFPKELREDVFNKIKSSGAYISITAIEDDVIHSPISWNYIKDILSDYPDLIQSSLYSHWLKDAENIERLFQLVVDNKNDLNLTEDHPLFKEAKCIVSILGFFPSEVHEIILPSVRENLSKSNDYSPITVVREILSIFPEFKKLVNEKIRHILDLTNNVADAKVWIKIINSIGLSKEHSSLQEARCIWDVLDDFPQDLAQTVFESIKPIVYETQKKFEVIEELLNQRPELQGPLLNEYMDRLVPANLLNSPPSLEDVKKAILLSKTIIQNAPSLGIDSNHILMEKAHNLSLTLKMMPEDARADALEIAVRLFNSSDFNPYMLFRVIYEYRADLHMNIKEHLRVVLSKNEVIDLAEATFLILNNRGCFLDLVEQALNLNARINDFLFKDLEGDSPEKAGKICKLILCNPILFHNFLDTALCVKNAMSKESLEQKNNPYTLFAKHKRGEMAPFIKKSPIYQTVDNKKISLRFNEITRFLLLKIDYENFPVFSYQEFNSIINQAFERINNLNSEEVENYIQNITGHSSDVLVNNFQGSSYLRNLLNETESIHRLQFSAILSYIVDQDNILLEGALLSPREEALLKMSASIQNCSVGKSEGIEIAYSHLPLKYKIKEIEDLASPQEQLVKSFLKNAVNHEISHILSDDTPFLRKLLRIEPEENEIQHLSHQSLFLKNLIGKRVGLNHKITFDLHSELIHPYLIKLSIPEGLTAFYEYFTPQMLVSTVVNSFERIPHNENGSLFQAISSLGLGEMEEIWDISSGLQLKERGAILLLLKLGLLQE